MASSSTNAGVVREIPVVPFNVAAQFTPVRGMVVQWNPLTKVVEPWSSGTNVGFGVATGDPDGRLLIVDVYVGRGCSVLIKCDVGIVPNPNDFLFWSAAGVCSNNSDGNPPFARAVGVGMNGFIESVLI